MMINAGKGQFTENPGTGMVSVIRIFRQLSTGKNRMNRIRSAQRGTESMRSYCWMCFVIVFIAVQCSAEDARTLLLGTLAKYKKPSVFQIEGTQETTVTDQIQRDWHFEQFRLVSANRKYHFEIKTPEQWNVAIGDGKAQWIFQPWKNEYTLNPVSEHPSDDDPDNVLNDFVTRSAWHYIQDSSLLKIGSAEFLP